MITSQFTSPETRAAVAGQPHTTTRRKSIGSELISTLLVVALLVLLLTIPFILSTRQLSVGERWMWTGVVLGSSLCVLGLLNRVTR